MNQSLFVLRLAAFLPAVLLAGMSLSARGLGDLPVCDSAAPAQSLQTPSQGPDIPATQNTSQPKVGNEAAPTDQTALSQPAAKKDLEAEPDKPQPGRTAREAVEDSMRGNGGRVFGVLPNYRTTNTTEVYKPLRVKDKWLIASHDVFDATNWVIAGFWGGIHQANNSHPEFGQGVEGYAKYYGTAFLDQGVGNIMTEGVFSTLFHQDPRYFRRGTGSVSSRLGHAILQSFVARSDSGKLVFNSSEWVGNAAATSLQNLYYTQSHNAAANAINYGNAMATDMVSQVLKEFWPDIKKRLGRK